MTISSSSSNTTCYSDSYFDTPVNRKGTNCLKHDCAKKWGKSDDLLSMWVADMDFKAPQVVIDAIKTRAEHGVFGYTAAGQDYYASVINWMNHYGWNIRPEWIVSTPGVVFALGMAVQAFTYPGEAILIQRPVYYPFTNVITYNNRKLVNAPLILENSHYSIDYKAFEQAILDNEVKMFILCNPHNPVGRLWTRDELMQLAQICLRHNVLVVSDEIHMDFFRPGKTHTIWATLNKKVEQKCIVCTAPSKTFNLAGLNASNIIIPNENLRHKFTSAMTAVGVDSANLMGLIAAQACYEHGQDWLAGCKNYLEGNWETLAFELAEKCPQLKLIPSESTYLAWVDCRELGLYGEELRSFIEDDAKLWLDFGTMFGPEGDGFIRLNLATQRNVIIQAVDNLANALRKRED